jgi:hypothetical protein
MLLGIAAFRSEHVHNVGHSAVSAVVTKVSADTVFIHACIDTTGLDTLDHVGRSVRGANAPGAYWRFIQDATVVRHAGTWVVQNAVANRDKKC